MKGFTDPDLTEIRSQFPALSRLSRQLILQLSASRGFRLRKGDVKTAFLSGDREEARRDVCAEPPPEMRDKLQITREQKLKLETAVYGLRNAPRAWWKRVGSVYLRVHEVKVDFGQSNFGQSIFVQPIWPANLCQSILGHF